MIFHQNTPYPTLLSHIVFVLILAELYRTLIFYLREYCVSVVLIVEVAWARSLLRLQSERLVVRRFGPYFFRGEYGRT